LIYVYAIIFMLATSPILILVLGLIANWAARGGRDALLNKARILATVMHAAQFALPSIALYFLWVRVIACGYEEQGGATYVNFLPDIICLPYSLWFANYALGELIGVIGAPFGDPRPRFWEASMNTALTVRSK